MEIEYVGPLFRRTRGTYTKTQLYMRASFPSVSKIENVRLVLKVCYECKIKRNIRIDELKFNNGFILADSLSCINQE